MQKEEELRQKIGCYTRCDGLNASCHVTCVEYEEKVLPFIKNK